MKILIDDDDADSLHMLCVLLRGNGDEVETATNGVEALVKSQKNGFDMIIADILMPRMDGFQPCRAVKTDERLIHKLEDKMLELERTNKALRESEDKYRELVENANDVVIVIDPGGCVSFCNPKFCELMGYTMEEAQGLHFRQFIHPDDLEQVAENLSRRLAEEDVPPRYEVRCVTKSGETLHVEISVNVIERNGKIVGALSIARDVTDRKRAEAAMHETNRRLEETLDELQRALGTMASGLAHDFNNVLMPILGYAELLLMSPQDWGDNAKVRDSLQIIHIAAPSAARAARGRRAAGAGRDYGVSAAGQACCHNGG